MLTCKRCGKSWPQRIQNPRVCPKCHNAWWDIERGNLSHRIKLAQNKNIKQEPVYASPSQPIYAQPVYQPPRQDAPIQIAQPLQRPPQMPDGIQPPGEFYPGQHPERITKGREAIKTMMNDLQNPKQSSINPDMDMQYPARKCKKCGHVGLAPEMANHKC